MLVYSSMKRERVYRREQCSHAGRIRVKQRCFGYH